MNLHDSAVRLRQIASDILDVSEAMSEDDGYVNHIEALRVTAVVVESILNALRANHPQFVSVLDYRNAFVEILDLVVLKFEVKA